jgi:myo-inositol-1(or 4)-monophosphatase
MKEHEEYLEFAKGLAADAGKIMLQYFHAEEIGLETKADDSPVTLADKGINSLVIERVKLAYPKDGVFGEEESYKKDSSRLWIVDPVDGTFNFAHGIPLAVFSMALVVNGQPEVAVIYDPFTDRLYWAVRGSGAYLNGRKLDVSKTKKAHALSISSWVAGGVNGTIFKDINCDEMLRMEYKKHGKINVEDLPVAQSLALVAAEFFDGSVSSCKNPWDLVAGGLIAKEAGMVVTDIYGQPIPRWDQDIQGIMAAPPEVHKKLLSIIKPVIEDFKYADNRH